MLNTAEDFFVRRWLRWPGVLPIALLLSTHAAVSATFSARLDRTTVEVGDALTITLIFEGGIPPRPPPVPEINNVRSGYRGESQNTQIFNGQIHSSVSYSYALSPTQPGDYRVPAIEVSIDGQKLKSAPLVFRATAGLSLGVFDVSLPKADIYLGETFVAQLSLHLDPTVLALKDFHLTPWQTDGFTVGTMVQAEQTTTQISNRLFNTIPFKLPLTAAKTGPLTLEPAECRIVVGVGPVDVWGRPTRNRAATFATPPKPVTVLPLPADGVPPTFTGAVGHFRMRYTASPITVAVGDPVTMRIEISGTGSLESVTLPTQPNWENFRIYAPNRTQNGFDPATLRGTNQFELIVSPLNAEVKELPAFQFSFFDPEAKTYRTLSQQPMPLHVVKGVADPPLIFQKSNQVEVPSTPREIIHIKPQLGALADSTGAWQSRWFIGLNLFPPILWLVATGRRRRRDYLERNPRIRRRCELEQTVRVGLDELRSLAVRGEGGALFAQAFRLLQEMLGERLDLPASGITESIVEEQLRPKGLDERHIAELQQLFQSCNQARYAPADKPAELSAFVSELARVLKELQHWNPRHVV